jgi:hypothetical protein
MPIDRYTRVVLTVIAGALVYLCLVLTPWPVASAQNAQRPGEPTGPGEMVIVGWRVPSGQAIPVEVSNEVRVQGDVRVSQGHALPLRVLLAGWEENGQPFQPGAHTPLTTDEGLPVTTTGQ